MADPYASSVVLHLPGNIEAGTRWSTGSRDIIWDASVTQSGPGLTGNPTISATQFKYGNASIYFAGGGDGNYLSFNNSSDFAFGTGDFTIEMWIYLVGYSSTWGSFFWDARNNALSSNGTCLNIQTLGNGANLSVRWNTTTGFITGGGPISLNTWYHVGFQRASGTVTAFVNGASVGTPIAGDTTNITANTPFIGYSANSASTTTPNGYVDDFRITKGVARYTFPFTPPLAIEYVVPTFSYHVGLLDPFTNTPVIPYYARPGQVSGQGPAVFVSNSFPKETPSNYGGGYKITGTVQRAGSLPYSVQVLIYPEDAPSRCIASTFSDPSTGVYTVNRLAAGNYIVVGVDPTGTYNDIAYNYVSSVPM